MKHYSTPELDFIKWQQDIVTASLVGDYDEEEGDVVAPGKNFWS